MKIKYSFKNVSSNSSTIKVMANDVTVLTLNKADCTSSDSEVAYDRLNSGELGPYYLEDIDCNDLETLTITGAEQHAATYTPETNTEWKEYAHNKIGSNHFKDSKWIASCDANTPIVVYNQGSTPTTYSDFTSFISSIPTTFPTGYTLDLSNIDASKVSDYLSATNYWVITYSPFSKIKNVLVYSYKLPNLTSMNSLFYDASKLKKAPEIPNSVTDMQSAFKGCTSLIEASEIPNSVTNMNYAFIDCTSLIEPPLEIPNSVKYMYSAFNGCTSLTKLPKLPSGNVNMEYAFSNCTGLKDIDVLDIRTSSSSLNTFYNCNFDTIKNLVLTGGNMYAFDIYSCKHLGVVTTNSLYYSSSSNSAASSTYVYYYYSNGYCYNVFSGYPIKIDAFSYKISNVLWAEGYNNYPTSSGFNYWVDYIASDTEAVHQITQRTINISKHFGTLETVATFSTDAFELLLVNPDYVDSEKEGHTFELKDFTIVSQTPSSYVNSSNAVVSVDADDASKCIISLDCTDIKDNSISSVSVVVKADYNAVIDGYAFLGETQVTVNVSFDFENIETMTAEAEIDRSTDTTTNA